MVNKSFVLLFLFLYAFLCEAQVKPKTFANLNNGSLLVRLHKRENQIKALEQKGMTEEAQRLKATQEKINKNIVSAFQEKYTLTPVYFFYAEQSQAVKDKNFTDVVFLNKNLETENQNRFTGGKFMTAEFAALEQDQIPVTSKYDKARNTQFHNGNVSTFEALVLKDDQLVQIPNSELIYIKTYKSMFLRRDADLVVQKFTKKLAKKLPKKRHPKT